MGSEPSLNAEELKKKAPVPTAEKAIDARTQQNVDAARDGVPQLRAVNASATSAGRGGRRGAKQDGRGRDERSRRR